LKYVDPDGHFWETLFDVVSACWSAWDLINRPSWGNLLYLGWDVGSIFIPFVPGSYLGKGVKGLAHLNDYKRAGVWAEDAFERGRQIETMLGGMGNNFPKIDKFVKGADNVATSITSIKSLDVTAKSYNKGRAFYNTLKGYVDDLVGFTDTQWNGITVFVDKNTKRILELALPPVELTPEQVRQLQDLYDYANDNGVQIIIHNIE
jgi:hypothetical protein